MTSELLRQVRVLDPASGTDRVADVWIESGQIRAIADHLEGLDAQVRAAKGLVLAPGLVDLYSHTGEPGFEDRETLASLMQAAQAGGFTRLTVLPDTRPVLDHPGSITWLQSRWQALAEQLQGKVRLQVWGALSLNLQGEQMTEIADLRQAGVVGWADGRPLQSSILLRRLLEYQQGQAQPMAFWPCDRALTGNGVAREGLDSILFGLPGNPAIAETAPLAALLEIVAERETPVHIMRVSTARSVALIQAAKAQGLPVTASTTWMHLLQNTHDLKRYDPNLRLDPPLGTPEDQAALQAGVRSGVIDAIAIDHTPYTYEEKTVAFSEAPAGAIGLELALPLLWHTLVEQGDWSALELWSSLSLRPAQCLGQALPILQAEHPAELILFDPHKSWRVEPQTLKSLAVNTPWLHHTVTGQVLQVWSAATTHR